MRQSLRQHLVLLLVSGCAADSSWISLWVDADPAVVALARSARVVIANDGRALDETGPIELSGQTPECLPFSIGLAPSEGSESSDLSFAVELEISTGQKLTRSYVTRFLESPALFEVFFGADCLGPGGCGPRPVEPELVDPAEVERRTRESECRAPEGVLECIDSKRCYGPSGLVCGECLPSKPLPPAAPQPPALPSPPELLPCPAGFEDSSGGCDPRPDGRFPSCAADESWLVGSSTCAALSVCSGRWPATIPPGAYYVDPRAPDGDGTLSNPWSHFEEVRVPEGSIVALAEGEYGDLSVSRAIQLVGACSRTTRLSKLTVSGGLVRVSELYLSKLDQTGGRVVVTRSEIEDSKVVSGRFDEVLVRSLQVLGSSVSGDRLTVLGDASISGTATFRDFAVSGSLRIEASGDLEVLRSELARVEVFGAFKATEAHLSGTLTSHGQVAIERFTAEAGVESDSGEVTLIDGLMRRTGISIAGSALQATRVRVESPLAAGVELSGPNAIGSIRDLVVLSPRPVEARLFDEAEPLPDPAAGSGVLVLAGAVATLQKARIEGHRIHAIAVDGSITVSDLSIAAPNPDSDRAAGIIVSAASRAQIRRASFFDGRDVVIRVLSGRSDSANIELEDLEVGPTTGTPARRLGIGLEVGSRDARHELAKVSMRRARFSGNLGAAVAIWRGDLEFEDLEVEDTWFDRTDFIQGSALYVNTDCKAEGTRARFLRSQSSAMTANGMGASIHITDYEARLTTCDDDDYCNLVDGVGAVSQNLAYIEVERFLISENASSGVEINLGASADLRDGEISGNVNGTVVREPGYDLTRIARGVLYRENGINIFAAE